MDERWLQVPMREMALALSRSGVALLLLMAVVGCRGEVGEAAPAAGDAGLVSRPLDSAPTPPVDTLRHFGRRGGGAWARADSALEQLSFVGGGPAATQSVDVCHGCPQLEATIFPEAGSHRLRREDFPGTMRIIARVRRENAAAVSRMGFGTDNATDDAFLAVLDGDSAAFFYRTRTGTVGRSPAWRFSFNSDGNRPAAPAAAWQRFEHGLTPRDTAVVTHLSGLWVACMFGCCAAHPD